MPSRKVTVGCETAFAQEKDELCGRFVGSYSSVKFSDRSK